MSPPRHSFTASTRAQPPAVAQRVFPARIFSDFAEIVPLARDAERDAIAQRAQTDLERRDGEHDAGGEGDAAEPDHPLDILRPKTRFAVPAPARERRRDEQQQRQPNRAPRDAQIADQSRIDPGQPPLAHELHNARVGRNGDRDARGRCRVAVYEDPIRRRTSPVNLVARVTLRPHIDPKDRGDAECGPKRDAIVTTHRVHRDLRHDARAFDVEPLSRDRP